jgi:hypothetical protein
VAWPLISGAPLPLTFPSTETLPLFAHRRPQTGFNGKIPVLGFFCLEAQLAMLALIFHKETAVARPDMVAGWLVHNGIFRAQKLSMFGRPTFDASGQLGADLYVSGGRATH